MLRYTVLSPVCSNMSCITYSLCPPNMHDTAVGMRISFCLATVIPAFEFLHTVGKQYYCTSCTTGVYQMSKQFSAFSAFKFGGVLTDDVVTSNLRALEISYMLSNAGMTWLWTSQVCSAV